MSRLKTISDKLDYIAMGKLNKEQMEYICEIDQEVNLKDREIERLNNIINEAIDKAKTMKASMLIDAIDGIEIDSKFVHDLFALIEYMENELKGVDKE